jgi:addiction module HigA family antidote
MTHTQLSARAFWICAIITVVSAVVSASFSVTALIGAARQDQYAMYAASRSVALLLASLACIGVRSRHGVMALALTMGLVQALDALIGLVGHNLAKTYGPLGEILLDDFLKPMGISQYRLAQDITVPPRRINEIVHGSRRISADTALRLARYFGTTERFWLNLQSRFDLEEQKDLLGNRLAKEVVVLRAAS